MFNEDEHIENLLRWLINEVMSAGGDGDAIWYSENYTIEYILPYVQKVNEELNLKWDIETKVASDGKLYIVWYWCQSCLIITNSKEMWNNKPDWSQCSICW
jgi:hypothetical protein